VSSLARFEAVFTYLLMFTHSYAELVPGLHIETFRVVVLVFVARPLVDDFWPHVSRSARSYARDAIRWPFISFWAVILIFVARPPVDGFWLPVSHSTRSFVERLSGVHFQAFGLSSSFLSHDPPRWFLAFP